MDLKEFCLEIEHDDVLKTKHYEYIYNNSFFYLVYSSFFWANYFTQSFPENISESDWKKLLLSYIVECNKISFFPLPERELINVLKETLLRIKNKNNLH